MFTFWTLRSFAVNGRGASGAGEGASMSYVESKAALWTLIHSLRLRTHLDTAFTDQAVLRILEISLETLKRIEAEILNSKQLDIKPG
jgi:hypothetical protein